MRFTPGANAITTGNGRQANVVAADSDELLADCAKHGLGPGMGSELGQDVAHVVAHRRRRDPEFLSDRASGPAHGQELDDLPFPACRYPVRRRHRMQEVFDLLSGQAGDLNQKVPGYILDAHSLVHITGQVDRQLLPAVGSCDDNRHVHPALDGSADSVCAPYDRPARLM